MTRIARTALAALALTLGAAALAAPSTALACGPYGMSPADMARFEAEDAAIDWVLHGFYVRTEVVDIPRVDVDADGARAVVQIRYRYVVPDAETQSVVLHLARREGRFVVAGQSFGKS